MCTFKQTQLLSESVLKEKMSDCCGTLEAVVCIRSGPPWAGVQLSPASVLSLVCTLMMRWRSINQNGTAREARPPFLHMHACFDLHGVKWPFHSQTLPSYQTDLSGGQDRLSAFNASFIASSLLAASSLQTF